MESLQVRTGQVSLMILDDLGNERGIFTFNPTDVESARQVMNMQSDLNAKQEEFEMRAEQCTTETEKADLLVESVTYFRDLIDTVFGAGSSQLLFGDAKTFSMFEDFFNGIMPYYQKASKERMAKYKKQSGK